MIRRASLFAALAMLAGCSVYEPIEPSPEAGRRLLEPGDSIRVVTRDDAELKLLVTAIDDERIRARRSGARGESFWLALERIRRLEVERLSMRRSVLVVVLPVAAAVLVACNDGDCTTSNRVEARF